jgi:hypothetical protein
VSAQRDWLALPMTFIAITTLLMEISEMRKVGKHTVVNFHWPDRATVNNKGENVSTEAIALQEHRGVSTHRMSQETSTNAESLLEPTNMRNSNERSVRHTG